MKQTPRLSIVVIVYDMPSQAMNTLYSLSPSYQQGVNERDYEIIVMENHSKHCLDPVAVAKLGNNFHYQLREEKGVSPAPAINAGLAECRGDAVGLLIDGARMLSPGVINRALQGLSVPDALVAVPGYFLTPEGNSENSADSILQHERELLRAVNWQKNGYKLFQQAVFSHGNARGYLNQMMECNALFCPKSWLQAIGGADEQFNLSGGGSLNLHLYRQLATRVQSRLITLLGEGNFHQFHGGTSTTAGEERDARVNAFNQQLNSLWPGGFKGITREPWLLGSLAEEALPYLEQSANNAAQRFGRLAKNQTDAWADETAVTGWHGEQAIPAKKIRAVKGYIRPRLSIIVMVYRMPRQAMNTLHSLTPAYQQGVHGDEYEVIVMENSSDQNLSAKAVTALGPNFHYHLRDEHRPTPVYTVNEGLEKASGDHVCLMVDGARLLSPRVLTLTLSAMATCPAAIVAVPGYHIGETDQKFNRSTQYDEAVETKLLATIDWQHHGYRLFDISIFSGANPHGLLHPLLESNCLTVPRSRLLAFGGANEGFQSAGGGAFNLDIYRGIARQQDLPLFVLHGEGSFHQYHGGVTTMEREDLDTLLDSFQQEYRTIRNEQYQAVRRQPILFGPLTSHSLPFVQQTITGARKRFARFRHEGRTPWPDDRINKD